MRRGLIILWEKLARNAPIGKAVIAGQIKRPDNFWIIYPGNDTYPVTESITALPFKNLESIQKRFRKWTPSISHLARKLIQQ